jgi:methylated-DNA-protein-cysteine methyltransferase-like protein
MEPRRKTPLKTQVESLVAKIPRTKVMTYGQIAAICGSPRAARIVGGIAHYGDPKLPWHRVVKKDGSLAEGYPGGVASHQKHLSDEGVKFEDNKVIMSKYLWIPR